VAHFRAEIKGSRGGASRLGTAGSGMTASVGSWEGGVRVEMWADGDVDMVRVRLIPWHGHGTERVLYEGRCDGEPDATALRAVRALA
jgi:hypothetical protein